jgi:hypothetical protein
MQCGLVAFPRYSGTRISLPRRSIAWRNCVCSLLAQIWFVGVCRSQCLEIIVAISSWTLRTSVSMVALWRIGCSRATL